MKDVLDITDLSVFISELPIVMALVDPATGKIKAHSDLWKDEFDETDNIYKARYVDRLDFNKAIDRAFAQSEAFILGEDESRSLSYKWKLRKFGEDTLYIQWVTMLSGQEYRLHHLCEMANRVADIGYWEVNLLNDQIHWSTVTRQIHRVPEDFQPNMTNALAFYKGENRAIIDAAVGQAIAEKTSYNVDLVIEDYTGNQVDVNARGQAEFVNGQPVRLVGTFQDITERKQRKQLLRDAKERYEKVLDSALVGFVTMDLKSYKILTINRPVQDMFEGSSSEIIDKQLLSFVNREDKSVLVQDFYKVLNSEKTGVQRQVPLFTLKGKPIYVDCYLYINRDRDDNSQELVVQLNDVTELVESTKKNDQYLEALTKQNDRLINFAHIVSHNLRSHTSNISMLLTLMEFEDDEAEKENQLQMLKKASVMLAETIDHLNEVIAVDIEDKERERVNLKANIDNAIEATKGLIISKNITVRNMVDNEIIVNVVPAYLDSIILNMLTNGIKYCDLEKKCFINFRSERQGDSVILYVEDNGLGINLDRYGDKMFKMYKTFHNNEESRGLGLYMTKSQIEVMGGSIGVESKEGKGTTFKIEFV